MIRGKPSVYTELAFKTVEWRTKYMFPPKNCGGESQKYTIGDLKCVERPFPRTGELIFYTFSPSGCVFWAPGSLVDGFPYTNSERICVEQGNLYTFPGPERVGQRFPRSLFLRNGV
jgi:hypothetical protein